MPGKGNVIKTGKLGDVMKESIQAAESYVKSRAASFGIEKSVIEKSDIHLHVPEATPKMVHQQVSYGYIHRIFTHCYSRKAELQ